MRTLWPEGAPMGDQNPHSWGRYYWAMLHSIAARVAAHPYLRAAAVDMLWTLRDVLPCTTCRKCFRSNLTQNPPAPDCDLAAWLLDLEQSIERRQRMQPIDSFVVSVVPRTARPAIDMGDDEMGLVVAFALKAGAGRNLDELVRWTKSFNTFLAKLVEVLDPPGDSLLRVFARHSPKLPSMRYDLYRFLESCVIEHSRLVQSRVRALRQQRAREKQMARGNARDPEAAVLRAKGVVAGLRRTVLHQPAAPAAPVPRPRASTPEYMHAVLGRRRQAQRVRRPSTGASLAGPRAGRQLRAPQVRRQAGSGLVRPGR